jgi:hypothetical protein
MAGIVPRTPEQGRPTNTCKADASNELPVCQPEQVGIGGVRGPPRGNWEAPFPAFAAPRWTWQRLSQASARLAAGQGLDSRILPAQVGFAAIRRSQVRRRTGRAVQGDEREAPDMDLRGVTSEEHASGHSRV